MLHSPGIVVSGINPQSVSEAGQCLVQLLYENVLVGQQSVGVCVVSIHLHRPTGNDTSRGTKTKEVATTADKTALHTQDDDTTTEWHLTCDWQTEIFYQMGLVSQIAVLFTSNSMHDFAFALWDFESWFHTNKP